MSIKLNTLKSYDIRSNPGFGDVVMYGPGPSSEVLRFYAEILCVENKSKNIINIFPRLSYNQYMMHIINYERNKKENEPVKLDVLVFEESHLIKQTHMKLFELLDERAHTNNRDIFLQNCTIRVRNINEKKIWYNLPDIVIYSSYIHDELVIEMVEQLDRLTQHQYRRYGDPMCKTFLFADGFDNKYDSWFYTNLNDITEERYLQDVRTRKLKRILKN